LTKHTTCDCVFVENTASRILALQACEGAASLIAFVHASVCFSFGRYFPKETAQEQTALLAKAASLSVQEKRAIQTQAAALHAAQQQKPAVEVLPTLSRRDIPATSPPYAVHDVTLGAARVQFCPQPTNGVVYVSTALDISALRPTTPPVAEGEVAAAAAAATATATRQGPLSWTEWDQLPLLASVIPLLSTGMRTGTVTVYTV
jgi:hypothetical protein